MLILLIPSPNKCHFFRKSRYTKILIGFAVLKQVQAADIITSVVGKIFYQYWNVCILFPRFVTLISIYLQERYHESKNSYRHVGLDVVPSDGRGVRKVAEHAER